jgi:hypothetical protein
MEKFNEEMVVGDFTAHLGVKGKTGPKKKEEPGVVIKSLKHFVYSSCLCGIIVFLGLVLIDLLCRWKYIGI